MSEQMKTVPTTVSALDYIETIEPPAKREDAKKLLNLFKKITGKKPVMWGESIIGFGEYRYKRKDGSEHSFAITGFSPRKQNLTLYLMLGMKDNEELLMNLGPHKKSVGCLYIKRLSDIEMPILTKLIEMNYKEMQKRYDI